MRTFLGICTLLGCTIGGLILLVTIVGSNGAPQEAAGAALAIAFAAIPYCFQGATLRMRKPSNPDDTTIG